MCQRFEPIGKREPRIGVLGLLKRLCGLAVFEVVQLCDAAQEGRLRRGGTGVREVDDADADLRVPMLRLEMRGECQSECGVRGRGAANVHRASRRLLVCRLSLRSGIDAATRRAPSIGNNALPATNAAAGDDTRCDQDPPSKFFASHRTPYVAYHSRTRSNMTGFERGARWPPA